MKRFLIGLITILSMICCLSALPAMAAGVSLYDEGNLLKSDENQTAVNRLQQASDKTGMNIIVILAKEKRSDATIESLADSTYDQVYGHKTNGLCYYMDLNGSSPYNYISTSGLAQFYYTNSSSNNRIDAIYSAIDKYLYPVGREDITSALDEFANQLEYYYDAGIPQNYYVYDDVYHEYYHVENGQVMTTLHKPYIDWDAVILLGLAGLIFGIIAGLITGAIIKAKYKFKYEISPTTYANKKSVRYHQQYDNFVTTRTTKTHVDRSGGGSHSGGHHSGGGHSHGGHGGGGHHR